MAPASSPTTSAGRRIREYGRQRRWCEWEEFDLWAQRVADDLDSPAGAAWPPFELLSLPGISADQQQRCAQRWMRQRLHDSQDQRSAVRARYGQVRARAADAPLRVGYLSGDFHQHATALLLIEMLEAHDPQRVAVHAYCHGHEDGSALRRRVRRACRGWHDLTGLDDAAAAERIHADGIDILVDLKGYTAGSRSILLAWRAAPLQVSFLGYPGTLGSGLADYLISDRYVTPAGSAAQYSEALACLPDSYQPHARHRAGHTQSVPAPTRRSAGLPDEGVVFCCFNQSWKFTPAVFDVWCRLLAATPGSVLWLLDDPCATGNLRREAHARGVAPHRLVFAPALPQAAHLARLPLADLVLDTWPYNAHTTASDALAAGVPVLTCQGTQFAGRVGGSLLHAVGLPELIAPDVPAYEALAGALAQDTERRRRLRARLARLAPQCALFDVRRYTRHLETLYDAMWARHAAGLAPAALDVDWGRPAGPSRQATSAGHGAC